MDKALPPEAARLGRRWVRPRALLAPLLALVLGALAAPALLEREPERVAPNTSRGDVAPAPAPAPRSVSAAPPPDRPAAPVPARELPPLASAWRTSVIEGQRSTIQSLVRALRAAPDGREQLLLLLEDPHPRVRAYALRELGRRRDPALRARFEAASADPAPAVRENARWALSELERAE